MNKLNQIARMREKKWGVMSHFLEDKQNNPESETNERLGKTTWDELVNGLNVENLAKELHEMKAGWFLFTIMQGTNFLVAPNATYDKIVGTKPGEACAKRDLVLDLYNALQKYDIDLYLYFTGDGPYKDEFAGTKMGFRDRFKEQPVPDKFLKNWSSVLKEYAERYKGKIKGWWIDGCYTYFGYTEDKLKYYYDAVKEADPNYLISFNDGYSVGQLWLKDENYQVGRYVRGDETMQPSCVSLHRYSQFEDYTSGEALDFNIYPESDNIEGSQWHILSPLSGDSPDGCAWGRDGVKYTSTYFKNYLAAVWNKGGIVTIDMGLKRSGAFFKTQKNFIEEVMKNLGF